MRQSSEQMVVLPEISWVDQATARYYLSDSANAGVDVFDAENNLYLGRIGGLHNPREKSNTEGKRS